MAILNNHRQLADLFGVLENHSPDKIASQIILPKATHVALDGKLLLYGGCLWSARITWSEGDQVILSNGEYQVQATWGQEFDYNALQVEPIAEVAP